MTPEQEEVVKLAKQGLSQSQIAKTLGISRRSVRGRLARGRQLDPGVQRAMQNFGTGMVPSQIWFKDEKYSVQVRPEQVSFIDQVATAFKDIPPAPQIPAPSQVRAHEMNMVPFFDVHLGMLAHAELSGEDYDLEIATERVKRGLGQLLARLQPAKRGILINGGDFTHQTDDMNRTRKSGHILDVASRNLLTVIAAVECIAALIEMMLQTHEVVEYYSVPGNHDPQNWETILIALSERYRNHERVKIDTTFREFSVVEHGKVAIFVHHGDKRLPKDLAMFCAAEYSEVWGRTSHRLVLTGHLHHLKADEFPGIYWTQLPAVTPRDYYSASGGYKSKSALLAFVFDEEGELGTHKVRL